MGQWHFWKKGKTFLNICLFNLRVELQRRLGKTKKSYIHWFTAQMGTIARAEPDQTRSQELWVSHVGGRSPQIRPSSTVFPRLLATSWIGIGQVALIWTIRITDGGFTHHTTMLAPKRKEFLNKITLNCIT